MQPSFTLAPGASDPASPPERLPVPPDTVPTGVPPERPFSPSAPVEVPPLGPNA